MTVREPIEEILTLLRLGKELMEFMTPKQRKEYRESLRSIGIWNEAKIREAWGE